jgi:hypothetical protein
LSGTTFRHQFVLRESRLDDTLYISNGHSDFRFALFSTDMRGPLIYRFMECEEVLLINSRFADRVNLYGLRSSQGVILESSEFMNEVNLAASQADALNVGREGYEAIWGPDAMLTLRLSRFRFIEDSPGSWNALDGRVDLLGLEYEAFMGWASTWLTAEGRFSPGATERSKEWLLDWLEKQIARDQVYMPQPYEQLAEVLERAGQPQKAAAVQYAKHEYWRQHATTTLPDYFWLTIKKYVIGYGYQVWLTVIWLTAVILAGAVVLKASRQGRSMGFAESLLYAVDQAFPLIYMNPANEVIAADHSLGMKYYFQAHQLLSLGLLAFLGAGLAGAIG